MIPAPELQIGLVHLQVAPHKRCQALGIIILRSAIYYSKKISNNILPIEVLKMTLPRHG
jgi:hypothetical protein